MNPLTGFSGPFFFVHCLFLPSSLVSLFLHCHGGGFLPFGRLEGGLFESPIDDFIDQGLKVDDAVVDFALVGCHRAFFHPTLELDVGCVEKMGCELAGDC